MPLPSFNNTAKKRDQMLSIDLGGRTTKGIHLQRKGDGFVLSRFVLLDAPIYEKNLSADLLGEHLKAVCQALDARTKLMTVAVGVQDSVVRHADLPLMPVNDMRQVLKNNTKNYLQQDLPGHIFDCTIMVPLGDKKRGKAQGWGHHPETKSAGRGCPQTVGGRYAERHQEHRHAGRSYCAGTGWTRECV